MGFLSFIGRALQEVYYFLVLSVVSFLMLSSIIYLVYYGFVFGSQALSAFMNAVY